MKKLNKIRLVMAGLLCGGLLLIGIGAGVGFGEFSKFTYSGTKMLSASTEKSYSEDVELFHQNGTVYIDTQGFNCHPEMQDCLITSEEVEPGTMHIELDYRSAISTPNIYHYPTDSGKESFYFSWSGPTMALLFAYKDEVLNDIKNFQLGEYREMEFSDLSITVNPADKDRIMLE